MSTLRYRSFVEAGTLNEDECTIHRAYAQGRRWWLLWFYVRCTSGEREVLAVPVNPGGVFNENGPGGRTWGLARAASGIWQVSPSIHVLRSLSDRAGLSIIASGAPEKMTLWHATPAIVGVDEHDAWARGDAP